MSRLSLTYGKMPTRDQFDDAFDATVGAGGTYSIKNDKGGRDGDYDSRDLWNMLNEQHGFWEEEGETQEEASDQPGDFVSAVLSTLGIEWI